MRILSINKSEEPENLLHQPVPQTEKLKMVQIFPGDAVDYGSGKVVYTKLNPDLLQEVRKTIIEAPTTKSVARLSSYNVDKEKLVDVTFGYKASKPVFGHTAGPVAYTVNCPSGYKKLSVLAEHMEKIAMSYVGDEFKEQVEKAKRSILPEYLISSTGFSQGVINRSNNLKFHYDRGNFKNFYSAMLWVIDGKIGGGELVIPSLNAFAEPVDGGVFIFKGQNIIHGVAPIKKLMFGAQRMSAVFYCHELLARAESQEVELTKSKAREFQKHLRKIT